VLDGVVPFPPEFAERYRDKGYWRDRSLAQEFASIFEHYAKRVAIIDRDARVTYAELDRVSDRLALNLLDAGLAPLDRVVVQLPNVVEFVFLYLALQKIGCIPIAALATHRFLEVSQFAKLSGAAACVTPDRLGDFDFTDMLRRVRNETASVKLGIVLGMAPAGFLSRNLISSAERSPRSYARSRSIPPIRRSSSSRGEHGRAS
jgi:2,3-dihydroxybenzoate-AMP ligase